LQIQILLNMRKIITFITFILLGFLAFSQNTSPLVVKDFVLKTNGIMDIEQVPRDARTDWDNNPVCMIQVKAVGFDENLMQKFVFVPNGLDIMHKTIRDGMVILYVSSNKTGEIVIKHMGDCTFKLPYKLEGHKIYVLTLGMETATLVIRTIPTNAEIYIDNQKVGTGEAISAVSIGGEHRYRVVCEDYYTKEGVVVFSKREEKSINVELEPNFSYIIIKTDPSGADVYIDDVKVGTTPYQMKKITLGNHVVELKKNGYESYADMISIIRGEINRQLENVPLTAMRVAYGTIFVTSTPEGADINIDGEYKGRTPQTIEMLIGEHTIVVIKEGSSPASKTVTVNENQTTNVSLYLESGREIAISTNGTGDKIYVDGNYIGVSPLKTIMGYGNHNVEAVRGDKKSKKSIKVEKTGGATSVHLDISDNLFITVNGVSFEMVKVNGGTYTKGKQGFTKQVTVGDYYIGKYEVTFELWDAVMGTESDNSVINNPKEYVSWNAGQEFVKRLNQLTGKNFRLPTEAEWEYAARGGEKSKGYKYSGGDNLDDVAWYYSNSHGNSHPVGTKLPNELGIYDMTGNVCEWCQDSYECYNPQYMGMKYLGRYWGRVYRGGGNQKLNYECDMLESYELNPASYEDRFDLRDFGIRLVINAEDKTNAKTGVMDITSNPEGATIMIDGKKYGCTPVTLDSVPGDYMVRLLKHGYEDVEQRIQVKAGWSETTVVKMNRIKQQKNGNESRGVFSVSDDTKVCFAKGNLQYKASTNTWRFAEQPWEVIGKPNEKRSQKYDGWIDLFSWGTGNNPIQPYGFSCDNGPFNDWGDNVISNGDGKTWFTLTNDEWHYVLDKRKTNSGINYVLATVNKVQGLIILPDDWDVSNYKLSKEPYYESNKLSQAVWEKSFEPKGAVFLPATAGILENKITKEASPEGYYWSSVYYKKDNAFAIEFHKKNDQYNIYSNDGVYALSYANRNSGVCVRLVCLAE